MKTSFVIVWMIFVAATAIAASAATLTGSVRNGTTGKPAAGDDVILLKLAGGMQEESRGVTDAGGRFSLEIKDAAAAHLVRVVHQKVNYHQPVPPGTSSLQVEVFDSAPRLAGVSGSIDLMRVQTDPASSSLLQVTEMLGVKNLSSPPKTQMSERSFEFWLPPQAQIDSAMAAGPGGMAVNTAPAPLPEKGHYAFIFPLRPGETKFQISYHLPYAGEANFAPRLSYGAENLAILLPSSMQFSPAQPGAFQREIEENGIVVQVAKNVPAGKAPAFRVAGSGAIPRDPVGGGEDSGQAAQNGAAAAAPPSNRPGGGLGTPEATPDPLQPYHWYILAGLATLLAGGAVWVVNRPRSQSSLAARESRDISAAPALDRAALLLEALKDELFQLEAERLESKISPQEYTRAKSALDETITRALRRRSSS
jgi:hypothetical protein